MTPITVSVCQEAVREVSSSKEEDKGEQTCEGENIQICKKALISKIKTALSMTVLFK